jgi:uncharacterized protein
MTRPSNCPIAVFAKAPRPGKAKTRLIPLLGPDGAAELQRRLLEHTLHTAQAAALGPIELWCTPNIDDPDLLNASTLVAASLHTQSEGDLGTRMAKTFLTILARTPRCILIGSDCPSLTTQDLREAENALDDHDAVLGPAEDGGYYLIGLRSGLNVNLVRLFENIEWGTDTVLEATRRRMKSLNLRWRELALRWDVDRPEDYARLSCEMPTLCNN